MSEKLKFDWQTNFTADSKLTDAGTLVIAGELVNGDICANNFALDSEELPSVASQVKDATLRVDHSKSARDVIGGLKVGTYDAKAKKVMFEAEVDDPVIQRSIMKGRLKYVSIGATADAYCSKCGKESKPRMCDCKGAHDVIKNIRLKEASIVTEPAYNTSSFSPKGFIAAVEDALSNGIVTTNSSNSEDAVGPLENKNIGERKMSKEVEATTMKPAGTDAVVLLAEKLEAVAGIVSKMEARMKKGYEEEEAKKKEDETKKQEAAYAKLEALTAKLEGLMAAKQEDEAKKEDDDDDDEDDAKPAKKEGLPMGNKVIGPKKDTAKGIPKDVPPSKFEEEDEAKKDEDTEPDGDECDTKKAKKEAKGSKVEDASGHTELTADAVPAWFKEIRAFAEKKGMLS